jgi:hypothetical protein
LAETENGTNQEPPTGDQSGIEQNKDITETEAQASSPPPKNTDTGPKSSSSDKVQGPARPPPKIKTGNQLSEFIYIQKFLFNCFTTIRVYVKAQ